MKQKNIIFKAIILCVVLLIFYLINIFLKEILLIFSRDGVISEYKLSLYKLSINIIFILVILLMTMKLFFGNKIKRYIELRKSKISVSIIYGSKYLSVILFILIILLSLRLVLSLDVSTDESTYVSILNNYFNNGKLLVSAPDNEYKIWRDLFASNITLIIVKPFINYSPYIFRYITLFYSVLLFLILHTVLRKKFGNITANIFLIIILSSPGVIFLTGSSFAENISILFGFGGLFLYKKYSENQSLLLLTIASLSMAISAATKYQFGFLLIGSIIAYRTVYFIKNKNTGIRKDIIFILCIFITYLLIMLIFFLQYDYAQIEDYFNNLYGSTSSIGGISSMTIPHLSSYFNFITIIGFNSIFLISIIIYYFVKHFKKLTFIESVLLISIVFNSIWFLYKGYNYRFIYYAMFFIYLLSTVFIFKITSIYKNKLIFNIFLIFLSLNLIYGVSKYFYFSVSGVNNNYQMYLQGTSFNSGENTFYDNSQKYFLEKATNLIDTNKIIIFAGSEHEAPAFFPKNKYIHFKKEMNYKEYSGNYIYISALVSQTKSIYRFRKELSDNAVLLVKEGDYELYEIK